MVIEDSAGDSKLTSNSKWHTHNHLALHWLICSTTGKPEQTIIVYWWMMTHDWCHLTNNVILAHQYVYGGYFWIIKFEFFLQIRPLLSGQTASGSAGYRPTLWGTCTGLWSGPVCPPARTPGPARAWSTSAPSSGAPTTPCWARSSIGSACCTARWRYGPPPLARA